MTGKIRVNLAMCPGYHDFGGGTRTAAIPGAQTTSQIGEGCVEVIIFLRVDLLGNARLAKRR